MHPHVDIESELRRLQDLLPMLVARLPAEEALAANVINRVAPAGQHIAAARELALAVARLPPLSVRA